MPSVLVREIIGQASTLLKDASPQFTRWTQRELVGWLNHGQTVLCEYLPEAGTRLDVIKLAQGTRQSIASIATTDVKAGDGVLLDAPLIGRRLLGLRRNMGSTGTTPGRAIRGPVSRRVLDAQDPDWHARTDTSITEYVFDPATPRYFDVVPGVTGTMWVEAQLIAAPVAIPNPNDNTTYLRDGVSVQKITVGDEYAPDLLNFVVGMAQLKDAKYADKAAAAYHGGLFLQSLGAKVEAATGTNPNLKRWPMQPAPVAAAS